VTPTLGLWLTQIFFPLHPDETSIITKKSTKRKSGSACVDSSDSFAPQHEDLQPHSHTNQICVSTIPIRSNYSSSQHTNTHMYIATHDLRQRGNVRDMPQFYSHRLTEELTEIPLTKRRLPRISYHPTIHLHTNHRNRPSIVKDG